MANILIVEDDRDLSHAYCLILEHGGHAVATAFNGREALEVAETFKPELVILDLLMPIMGGLEFLKRYKHAADTRVLIFTNMENSPEVAAAYKLGAHRCIIKSWSAPHTLQQIVDDTLKQRTAPKKPAGK